jgi:HEAT repeat protein
MSTGNRQPDDLLAQDARPTSEIVAAYLKAQREGDASYSLATVHYRGGLQEFQSGLTLLSSSDPFERVVGADVLAQLGWQDRTFLEESVDALLGALRDPNHSVVQSAIIALGHRASPRAIDAVLPFVDHPSADLRDAAVHGLMPHETPIVIDALVKLSRDADRDVRDWATFTLASQFDSDSSTLRVALRERVEDPDPEIRGEALVGLARRRDSGVITAILRELRGEFHGDWAVQAAGLLGDPQFLPALRSLRAVLRGKDAVYFEGTLESAIAACEGRRTAESASLQ